jgi:hypothetical protein
MKILKILALSLIFVSVLYSFEQPNVDFISMSMGDAGVASSYGAMSAYKNPALLSSRDNNRSTEIAFSIGLGLYDYKLGNDLNKISDADFSWTIDQIKNGKGKDEKVKENASIIKSSLNNLSMTNNNLAIFPFVRLSVKMGEFSFGVYSMTIATLSSVIDKDRLEYIVYNKNNDKYVYYNPTTGNYRDSTEEEYKAKSVDYAINGIGTTYLNSKAIALIEVPLSYSNKFEIRGNNIINYGITLKYFQGITTSTKISFNDDDYDPTKDLKHNKVITNTFGIDLGFIFRPEDSKFKLAIVGKNLNTPKFDTINPNIQYKLEPKITTGFAYSISQTFDIALDYDISETKDLLVERKTRYIGGGINLHPLSWLSMRAGIKKNLSDKENYEGVIYTVGASFGLKWLQIDAALQTSQNSGDYDGNEIPRYVKANLSLVSKWK